MKEYTLENKKGSISVKFFYSLMLLGFFFVSFTYYLGHQNKFYNWLFWGGLLICVSSTFSVIMNEKYSEHTKTIFLFLFGLSLFLPSFLWSPNYFHYGDELVQFKVTDLIEQKGNINVGLTGRANFDIPRFYPGLNLLTAVLNMISNLPIFYSGKIVVAIAHSLILVFIYLFFKVTYPLIGAHIGAFVYASNINYSFFNSIYAYESIGLLILILFLYIFAKYETEEKTFSYRFILLILIPALVIIHHFSSYMLLFFIVIFVLVRMFLHYNYKKELKLFFIILVYIFAWIIYVAIITLKYFNGIFSNAFLNILKFQETGTERAILGQYSTILPIYEQFINKFLYIPVLLIFFILGCFYIYSKKIRNPINISLVVYGIFFFSTVPLILTNNPEIGRFWTFFFIGVSFAVGLGINILYSKRVKFFKIPKILLLILILFIFMGGISIGTKPSYRIPSGSHFSILASGPSTITLDVFHASDWFEAHFGSRNKLVGDKTIITVFGGYGEQIVDTRNVMNLFYPITIDSTFQEYMYNNSFYIDYVVLDYRIVTSLAEYGSYFDIPTSINSYSYGQTIPLPLDSLNKFNKIPYLYKIYSNANIDIYSINWQMFSKDNYDKK